ncbi:hypothetical protein [Paraburkholderia oxyphila]|uniref:hypothetical protein n=1 Tax=Paraburkholderia oxyphila TaxID=614212 RepID=UPI00048906AF|nr:hypothetical protein [Paraburkholderia oxyphila]
MTSLAQLLARINDVPPSEVLPEPCRNWVGKLQAIQTAAPRNKEQRYVRFVGDVTQAFLIHIEETLRERAGLPPDDPEVPTIVPNAGPEQVRLAISTEQDDIDKVADSLLADADLENSLRSDNH